MNHRMPSRDGAERPRRPLRHVGGLDAPGDDKQAWGRQRPFAGRLHRRLSPSGYVALMGGSAVALFALVWLWIVTMPMAFLDPEYPAWRAKQMLLADCDLGDLLILGDSRAATAMMPATWHVRAANLAVGGGEPIEALAALDRALRCPVPPARVILSLDAVHFTEPDLFWERTARFGFVSADEIATLRDVSHALDDVSVYEVRHTDGLPSWLRDAMVRVRFPSLYFTSLAKGGVLLRWPRNRATLTASLRARGQYFFGTAAGSDTRRGRGAYAAIPAAAGTGMVFQSYLARIERCAVFPRCSSPCR